MHASMHRFEYNSSTALGPRTRIPRWPFHGENFFLLPLLLYERGYAARMSGSEFKRYVTLLRLSNFEYGKEIVYLTAKELALLDGVAPRTARQVHAKLHELGLLRKGEKNPRAHALVHPWCWPDLEGPKPRLQRNESGKVHCVLE